MDKKTLDVYNAEPLHFTRDWLSQPTPVEINNIAKRFFVLGGATADIGSGSGRDTAWLNQNGYPCTGFDAAEGLMLEARSRFPSCTFKYAKLPELREIADALFQNVLCETVIMHLPRELHLEAVRNLLRITAPGGTLSLSWRHPVEAQDSREKDGRLYESVDGDQILELAHRLDAQCVHRARVVSSSSKKIIDQLVLRRSQKILPDEV